MHHENTNLLNEVSKASKMGIDAIHILLPKIKQEEIEKTIKRPVLRISKITGKSQ